MYCIYLYIHSIYIYIFIFIFIYIYMHDRTFLSLLGASGPKGPSFRGGYRKVRYRIVWKCPSPSARGFSMMLSCRSCPFHVSVCFGGDLVSWSCLRHPPVISRMFVSPLSHAIVMCWKCPGHVSVF